MQWVKDFKLVDFGNMGLFPEYLEMGESPSINNPEQVEDSFLVFSYEHILKVLRTRSLSSNSSNMTISKVIAYVL